MTPLDKGTSYHNTQHLHIRTTWHREPIGERAAQSSRVRRLACIFGLDLDHHQPSPRHTTTQSNPRPDDDACKLPIMPHTIVHITGSSGAGKSRLLRTMNEALRDHSTPVRIIHVDPDAQSDHDAPLVDQLGASLHDAVAWLARAGLADAHAIVRPPGTLSVGERWRFALARAMVNAAQPADHDRPHQHTVVFADEFCATLDEITTASVCRNVRRWIDAQPLTLIVACASSSLCEVLDADVRIRCAHGASPFLERIPVVRGSQVDSSADEEDLPDDHAPDAHAV